MIDRAWLISEYLDGRMTAARFDDLQNQMRDDPALRRQLLTRIVIEQHLREPVRVIAEPDEASRWHAWDGPDVRNSRRGYRRAAAAIAAALVIAGAIGLIFTMPQKTPTAPTRPQPSRAVALLTHTENAVFAEDSRPMPLGGELRPGPIRLVSGSAQVMFESTAVVDLVGPCEFEITGPNEGIVHRGSVRAFVPGRAAGFSVATPHASIVDLGTAFNVNVNDQQKRTVIRVIEGQVAVTDLRGGRQSYRGGDEVRLDAGGIMTVRRDMTIVDVRANNDRAYTIQPHALAEDVPAHTDRNYQWNSVSAEGLPEALRGADYVMTPMADKMNHDLRVEVAISRPAVLYVFISTMGPAPEWLTERGFTETGWQIGLDNTSDKVIGVGPGHSVDLLYNVWSRTMPQAGRITLGPPQLENRTKVGTYGIAATALPESIDPDSGDPDPSTQPTISQPE